VTLSLAAIIPTFRRWQYLQNTVRDLNQQTRPPDEIVIVDQTPRQEVPEGEPHNLISSSPVPINYIVQERPRVYEARNRAGCAAECRILLYLDDDVVLPPDVVRRHLSHYSDSSVHAVVGPALRPGTETLYPPTEGFSQLAPEVQAYRSSGQFSEPMSSVGFMHAGNFSIRRQVLAEIGGWDERVITYGDRDLGIRLARQGYRIDYDPKASLAHLAAPVGGTRLSDPRSPWSSWERCVSIHLLAWRHLWRHPLLFVRCGLFRAARFSFLLRRNAVRPWRWPRETCGYTVALVAGLVFAMSKPKCSFRLRTANEGTNIVSSPR